MPISKIRIIRLVLLFFAGLILLLVISSPFIAQWAINTPYVKNELFKLVKENTDVEIFPSQIQFNIFPQFVVKIHNTQVDLTDEMTINIGSVVVFPELGPLLKGKLAITKVILENPDILFAPLKEEKEVKTMQSKVIPPIFNWALLDIKTFFPLLSKKTQQFEFDLKNVTSPYFKGLNGRLFISKLENRVRLDAGIKKIKLNQGLIRSFLPKDIQLQTMEFD
ncbi:MAG: hypothetical protein GY729_14905, partial [Desulfobacteraceae bacterium]|nr:hypothetical protein [Desulfobacteraceae bacterium]